MPAVTIPFEAPAGVRAALEDLTRSEDICWSPAGDRLALTDIANNRVLVLAVRQLADAQGRRMVLDAGLVVSSPALAYPHGLGWIDDNLLAVASREGGVALLRIPTLDRGCGATVLAPEQKFGIEAFGPLSTPGSLHARSLGAGLVELWVCSSFSHRVTHHLLDARAGFRPGDPQVLLKKGLCVPDGIALSSSGRWIAVSNHDRHVVSVYRNDEHLGLASDPVVELSGMCFPHGLCFLGGDQLLAVADAGAPHVLVFASPQARWDAGAGLRAVLQAMPEAVFRRGHHNPREGGPKGVAADPHSAVLATTCAEQPLAFFDLSGCVPAGGAGASSAMSEAENLRLVLLRNAAQTALRDEEIAGAWREHLRVMRESRSWRWTAPLRRLLDRLHKLRRH